MTKMMATIFGITKISTLLILIISLMFTGDGSLELSNDQINNILPELHAKMLDECTRIYAHTHGIGNEGEDEVKQMDEFDSIQRYLKINFFTSLRAEEKIRLQAVLTNTRLDDLDDENDILQPNTHEVGQELLLKMGRYLQKYREIYNLDYYSGSDLIRLKSEELTDQQLISELLYYSEIGMKVADLKNEHDLGHTEGDFWDFKGTWAKVERLLMLGKNYWADQLLGTDFDSDLDLSSDESSNSEIETEEGLTEEGLTVEGLTEEELTNRIDNFINRNRNNEDVLQAEAQAEFDTLTKKVDALASIPETASTSMSETAPTFMMKEEANAPTFMMKEEANASTFMMKESIEANTFASNFLKGDTLASSESMSDTEFASMLQSEAGLAPSPSESMSDAEFASKLSTVEAALATVDHIGEEDKEFLLEVLAQDDAAFEEFMSNMDQSIQDQMDLDFESYIDRENHRRLVNRATQNINRDLSEVLSEVGIPGREVIVLESEGDILRTERNEDEVLRTERNEEVIQENTLDYRFFLGLIPSLKLSYTIILGGVFISSLVISMYLYTYYKKTIVSFFKTLINFFY